MAARSFGKLAMRISGRAEVLANDEDGDGSRMAIRSIEKRLRKRCMFCLVVEWCINIMSSK